MAYNLTGLQNTETVFEIISFANEASNNIFAILFIFALFFLIILGVRTSDIAGRFAISSYVTGIIATMAWYMGLVHFIIPSAFGVMAAIFTMIIYIKN